MQLVNDRGRQRQAGDPRARLVIHPEGVAMVRLISEIRDVTARELVLEVLTNNFDRELLVLHPACSVSLGSGVSAEPSSPTGVASGCPLRRGSGGRCVVPVEVLSEPSPAVVRIKGRFRCCWGLRRGRLPGVGPLPERSLARVDERCRLRRGTFGWGQRD